jgi:adenylosuccinate synthase
MKQLIKALNDANKEIEGVEKNAQIKFGNTNYKAVSDKDVKINIGRVFTKHGLVILPTNIQKNVEILTEKDNYGKEKTVFVTDVLVTYTMYHTSGESLQFQGYGQAIDTGDKGAGKACTYALKYALLYASLAPTGNIEDTDLTHSDAIKVKNTFLDKIQSCKTIEELTFLYKNSKDAANYKEKFSLKRKELETINFDEI